MEALTVKLKACGRYLELEAGIPNWEAQRPELLEKIRNLELNRNCKQIDLDALENPNFFQRLLGRAEEKKEKLHIQLREITAALNAAQWELKDLNARIAAGKQELETLAGSREAYARAKQETVLTSIQEGQLMMEELAAFTPAALAAAERIIDALDSARIWMQEDARYKGVRPGNRKLEFLALAEENASRLLELLSLMPEGCAQVGSYLRAPGSYITGVTSEFKQLDRLNNAISQVVETRNQLRMLQ